MPGLKSLLSDSIVNSMRASRSPTTEWTLLPNSCSFAGDLLCMKLKQKPKYWVLPFWTSLMMLIAYKKGLKKGETCLYKPEAVGQKKTWKIEDLKAHVLVTHIL